MEEREKELNKLNAALVGTMTDAAPSPPEGMVTKITELLLSTITPEEFRQLKHDCEKNSKDISLELAKRFLSLPRTKRKRLCKSFDVPWTYFKHGN
jgi:hypothetical protein